MRTMGSMRGVRGVGCVKLHRRCGARRNMMRRLTGNAIGSAGIPPGVTTQHIADKVGIGSSRNAPGLTRAAAVKMRFHDSFRHINRIEIVPAARWMERDYGSPPVRG